MYKNLLFKLAKAAKLFKIMWYCWTCLFQPTCKSMIYYSIERILFDVLTSATSEKMLSLAIAYWQWDNSLNFPHFHEYFLFSNHLRVIKTKLLNFFGVWKWQVTSKQVVLLWCMCISIYWWDFLPENVKESIRTEN